MNVLIAGGGKVGRRLASLFHDAGQTVSVIEVRREHVKSLRELVPDVDAFVADATDPGALTAAGAAHTDVFIAATGSDEVNMLSCFLARNVFGIRRTIARVNDPRNEHMFTPEYGCDVAISYSEIIARIVIEETAFADVVTLLKLRRGQLSLLEGEVQKGSALDGKTLAEAGMPPSTIVAAILRGNETILPRGGTKVVAGDRLLALCSSGSEEAFHDLIR